MSFRRLVIRFGAVTILLPLHLQFVGVTHAQRTAFRIPTSAPATARNSISDRSEREEAVVEANEAPQVESADAGEGLASDSGTTVDLSPDQLRRRDRIRSCLASYFHDLEDARIRSPWGIMHALIPYGVDAQVLAGGRRVNAIAWLCWNGKGQDLRLFEAKQGRLQPLSGPGMQGHESQFLFMMAQSKVPVGYPLQVDGYRFTLRDLVEYEQANCESGMELNFKLVGLVHYLDSDATWVNRRGERWDIPRLIREELAQPIIGACCGGTHRLMGFSYAVRKREQRGEPVVGQWSRAKKYVHDYHEYAFRLQHPDGSFSTDWFRSRQNNGDPERILETTGHVLEWLTFSLKTEQLLEPRLVKSIDFVTRLLLEEGDREWAVGPKGHALHALALYDERVFGGRPGERAYLAAVR